MGGKVMTCFYCQADVQQSSSQQDHFPIPQRHGGERTVTACVTCHNLKDRVPLKNWPSYVTSAVLGDYPSRALSLILVAMSVGDDSPVFRSESGDLADDVEELVMPMLEEAPPLSRLFLARCVNLVFDYGLAREAFGPMSTGEAAVIESLKQGSMF